MSAGDDVAVDSVWDNLAAVYMLDVRAIQDGVETWLLALSLGESKAHENLSD